MSLEGSRPRNQIEQGRTSLLVHDVSVPKAILNQYHYERAPYYQFGYVACQIMAAQLKPGDPLRNALLLDSNRLLLQHQGVLGGSLWSHFSSIAEFYKDSDDPQQKIRNMLEYLDKTGLPPQGEGYERGEYGVSYGDLAHHGPYTAVGTLDRESPGTGAIIVYDNTDGIFNGYPTIMYKSQERLIDWRSRLVGLLTVNVSDETVNDQRLLGILLPQ